MLKSYYEILNVPEDASKGYIKKQYKKLAKMYHPDINSSLEAELKFKEINKAIEILLDDNKRKQYDSLRGITKPNPDTFKYKEASKPSPINGDDINLNIDIDFNEAILGTYRIINVNHSTPCPKCFGRKFSQGHTCQYCNGAGEITQNKKITLKIPSNIKNGAKLRLKNEGNPGKNGGKNGNLYVKIHIEKNQDFEISEGIIKYTAKISPYTAILGGDIKVPTLWGESTILIPPLTKSGQCFKLVGVGVLDEKTKRKGDEIITIQIQIPSYLTDEELKLYEKLKELNLQKTNAKTI